MNHLDFMFILPDIVLAIFAIIVLMVSFISNNKRILGLLSFLGVLTSFLLLPDTFIISGPLFGNLMVNDPLAIFFRSLSLIIAGIVILLSMGYKSIGDEQKGEYYFFILTITLSMMLASASNNLMMIYITLEAISLLSYILAGYIKKDMFSSEAGLKYFLFGALSTGITLYGVSLIYGLCGTLDLYAMWHYLAVNPVHQPVLILALLLVLVGFGFKCSLAPFHMWTPDVYQGAPTPIAAFFSVGPKAIGFVFLLRVFVDFQSTALFPWVMASTLIAVLSMTLGNIIAVQQDNIKRLLAYSTIAQAGYMLVGLAAGTVSGVRAVLFYLFVYALMNLGAFGVVIAVSQALNSEMIKDYAGLYKRTPFLAIILAVCLLSLAGIPPLAGFMAKFFVFAAAVERGMIVLVIIAALNSVVAFYYYLRVLKVVFLQEPAQQAFIPPSKTLQMTLAVIMVALFVLGVWPHCVLDVLAILLRI